MATGAWNARFLGGARFPASSVACSCRFKSEGWGAGF